MQGKSEVSHLGIIAPKFFFGQWQEFTLLQLCMCGVLPHIPMFFDLES
jgi:hypothetical protein